MREHLVFLLSGPLASFGSYAGHERRGSESAPLRSAILGLTGAALGVERTDTEGQTALRKYSVAVQPFQESKPLRDYHTVQTVATKKAKNPATRKEALERAGREAYTVVTWRDYRCDVLVGATLWGDGQWPLHELADHLRRPTFPLYLGRKSCPLASPLNPRVVTASGPVQALALIEVPAWLRAERWSEDDRDRAPVHSDPISGLEPPGLNEQVPGEPLDRQAWTFGERTVWHLSSGDKRESSQGGEAEA